MGGQGNRLTGCWLLLTHGCLWRNSTFHFHLVLSSAKCVYWFLYGRKLLNMILLSLLFRYYYPVSSVLWLLIHHLWTTEKLLSDISNYPWIQGKFKQFQAHTEVLNVIYLSMLWATEQKLWFSVAYNIVVVNLYITFLSEDLASPSINATEVGKLS